MKRPCALIVPMIAVIVLTLCTSGVIGSCRHSLGGHGSSSCDERDDESALMQLKSSFSKSKGIGVKKEPTAATNQQTAAPLPWVRAFVLGGETVSANHHHQESHACNRWEIDADETIGFIHIGKCAGTSMDTWLNSYAGGRKIVGSNIHADMSYMESKSQLRIMAWFREPAARSASNILFWQTLDFTRDWPSRTWTLSKILANSTELERYNGAFSDGMGGSCWLAGLCQNGWYIHTDPDGKNLTESERRSRLMHDRPDKVLEAAKANLKDLAWFGLVERQQESMELLQWQLGVDAQPMRQLNANAQKSNVTEEDLESLRLHASSDTELYIYAQQLFNERWAAYEKAKAESLGAAAAGCMVDTPMAPPVSLRMKYNSVAKDAVVLPQAKELSDFVSRLDI